MEDCRDRALKAENRALVFLARTYGTLAEEVIERLGAEGQELVYDQYHRSVRDACAPEWKKMERKDAEAYAEWLLDDLMEGYDYEYVEKTPESVRINIKSCPLARHFNDTGFGKLGMVFCDVDFDMIKDFNAVTGANLVFERDTVLMDGGPRCNHHIFVGD